MLGQAHKVRVICRRGRKNPKYTQDGSREWVTVIECIASDGTALPPFVIWKGATHLRGMYAHLFEGDEADFAFSPKGWTDNNLGYKWLVEWFEKQTKERQVTPSAPSALLTTRIELDRIPG